MMNGRGTQTIRTPRLTLRRFEPDDAAAMYRNWAGDEKTVKYLSWDIHESENLTRALLTQWSENYKSSEYYNWAMEYEGEVIGNISIVRQSKNYYDFMEFGYCMGSCWWGRGLMSEGVSAAVDYLFRTAAVSRLVIRYAAENTASGRVAEKCGFTREGVERGTYLARDGRHLDLVVTSLLRSEWQQRGTRDRIVLHTPRLILCPLTRKDYDAVRAYACDPDNMKFMYRGCMNEKAVRDFLLSCERNWALDEPDILEFAVVLRENEKVIGNLGFSGREDGFVWWILHPAYHRQGYASEAAAVLFDYAFRERKPRRINTTCDCENTASWKLMEKLGMVREGISRKARPNGHDELVYSILREEWEEAHSGTSIVR
ncbi:MAG: GNAT N-acetyltransferase [Clostridia bacterium]|nr:GNAT N-acetyltransferase [Clostridia bacterium]